MSRILDEIHETAEEMHNAGLIPTTKMQEFDVLCLSRIPRYTPEQIKRIRHSCNMSQKELALLLNISTSTVQKWESGVKKPAGAARKLLNVLEKQGVAALL